MSKRIPSDQIREITKRVLVTPGRGDSGSPLTVIPLVDGDEVAGLEIRCRCGARAVIDCVYDDAPGPDPSPQESA